MPIGGPLKTAIAHGWHLVRRLAPRREPRLTILYYHAVPAVDAPMFDRHMAYLAAHGNVVTPDYSGPLHPTRLNVAVAFDDAFESVRDHALPALARHGISATIYVPTGWLGQHPGWAMESDVDRRERVMDADSLCALPRDRIGFGSHTVSHPRLSKLSSVDRCRELIQSRAALEQLTGATIDTLAFPYGDHDAATIADARAAGYRHVYSVVPQGIRAGADDIYRGRTAVDASDSMPLFRLKAEGAFEWLPAAIRAKAVIRGLLRRQISRVRPS